MIISATHKTTGEKQTLVFASIKQAKFFNPFFINFKIIEE